MILQISIPETTPSYSLKEPNYVLGYCMESD